MTKESEQSEFPSRPFTNAEFPITFTEDGKYVVKHNDQILVEGTYKISGDKIVLTGKQGQRTCPEPNKATGKYKLET